MVTTAQFTKTCFRCNPKENLFVSVTKSDDPRDVLAFNLKLQQIINFRLIVFRQGKVAQTVEEC